MLCRVAAWSFAACLAAACLVAWPAHAGLELGTFADSDSSAAALTIVTQANQDQEKAEDKVKSQAEASAPSSPTAASPQIPAAASDNRSVQLASLEPAEPAVAPPPATEPFGLAAAPVAFGNVLTKWSGVEANIRADKDVLARCRENIEACPAPARDFLAIVDQGRKLTGRARIGVINRAVNLAIEPMSDMAQWGVPDRWSAPLETFTTHRGDCEDYAIAKYVALTQAGVPAADVKLVIVRNTEADEDHAVVAVHADGGWIMLDNRWLTLVEDNDMAKAIPLFVLDGGGVRQFMPTAMAGARRQSAPASLGF
jgi:predicted transglutaminase-like cysteine proteinase